MIVLDAGVALSNYPTVDKIYGVDGSNTASYQFRQYHAADDIVRSNAYEVYSSTVGYFWSMSILVMSIFDKLI